MKNLREIKEYIAKRDKALENFDDFMAFAKDRAWPGMRPEAFEIAFHKMRTAVKSIPIEMRRESWKWLTDRGYGTLDDKELQND